MKRIRDSNHLLRNSLILFIVILTIAFFICYGFIHRRESHLNTKILGYWSILSEQHLRKNDYYFTYNIIHFDSRIIKLPSFEIIDSNTNSTLNKSIYDSYALIWNNNLGYWRLNSINPDSIIINNPSHPLNGKYGIFFKKKLLDDQIHHYLLYLINDSTELILEKNFSTLFGVPPTKKQWEY